MPPASITATSVLWAESVNYSDPETRSCYANLYGFERLETAQLFSRMQHILETA
jgi:hypothetical protein